MYLCIVCQLRSNYYETQREIELTMVASVASRHTAPLTLRMKTEANVCFFFLFLFCVFCVTDITKGEYASSSVHNDTHRRTYTHTHTTYELYTRKYSIITVRMCFFSLVLDSPFFFFNFNTNCMFSFFELAVYVVFPLFQTVR